MNKRKLAIVITTLVVLCALAFYGHRRWGSGVNGPNSNLLAQMPANASAVVYIDLDALRQSPFLGELYKWAPPASADADYTEFLQSTGFNYERDLTRVSIAILKSNQANTLFAVADGHFDRKKISAYASQAGTRETRNGREIFSVTLRGSTRRISFTFLSGNRIALTNGANLDSLLAPPHADSDTQAWRERFGRLAGSPIFAVVRQEAGAQLNVQTPGGLRSPQLSALVDQLQWLTVGGKPEADHLRVVLEGEGTSDATTRQLSDVINGLLVLARAGLSDQKVKQQLQPDVREAYLEMLKSADVSQIDRGETKSVRLIFDLTPKFLEAARSAMPVGPAPQHEKPLLNKGTIRN